MNEDKTGLFLNLAAMLGSHTTVFTANDEMLSVSRDEMIRELYAFSVPVKIAVCTDILKVIRLMAEEADNQALNPSAPESESKAVAGALRGAAQGIEEGYLNVLQRQLDERDF